MKQQQKIFALVDINNCYVSCERVFNPKLNHRPVIVLSNNDGCAVARSQEAKALGVKMAVPLFQIQALVQRHHIQVLSSNYALYAEMSKRFHAILADFVSPDEQEIYSIDECFLDLTAYAELFDLVTHCHTMKQRLLKWLGLPTCIGLGRSKTEAKLANHLAKKNPRYEGICDLVSMDPTNKEYLFQHIDVAEVWGIGRKLSKNLNQMGIYSVLDLGCRDARQMQKSFSLVMGRTVLELQGLSCIDIDSAPQPRQQIIASRSFGEKITSLDDLKEALGKYVQDAVSRLRRESSLCACVVVFVQSNPFDSKAEYYDKSQSYNLSEATDNLLSLIRISLDLISAIYCSGIRYKKCGVILTHLIPKSAHIPDLVSPIQQSDQPEQLMHCLEKTHNRFGKGKLAIGTCYLPNRKWSMNRANLSRNYFSQEGMLTVER